MRNSVMAAVYNVVSKAASGISWYDTNAPAKAKAPFGVLRITDMDADDTVTTESDVFRVETRVIADAQDGQYGIRYVYSTLDQIRDAMNGAEVLNTAGSLGGGCKAVDLRRDGYSEYLDGAGFWHCTYTWKIRVTKDK